MKDLKENIQKNNMKKLVLSVVLGMFCYCTNNAMKMKIGIDNVLMTMIEGQEEIFKAKGAIKDVEGKIYSTIKDKRGKVKKGKLLKFIKNQIKNLKGEVKTKTQKFDRLEFAIKKIEQYFHLEEKENDYECTKDNLTEIFWNNEQKEETQKIKGQIEAIQKYFIRIASNESKINNTFQKYYKVKKAEKAKEGEEKKKEEIIEEITNECCKGDKEDDPHANFLANLGNICEYEGLKEQIEDKKKAILEAIQRRITLDATITKKALKYFIEQKIGQLDEKDKNKIKENGDKPKGEKRGCCSCCDCWEKNKNPEEGTQEE